VEHIATFIGPRIRDLAAAYIASPRLFGSARPRERAIEWGAVHTYRLIKADPPFEIFAEALERRDPATLYRRLIKPAARRGRVDILRALHGPLMVRPRVFFFPLHFLEDFFYFSACLFSVKDGGVVPLCGFLPGVGAFVLNIFFLKNG
jgi:hypothetical protein